MKNVGESLKEGSHVGSEGSGSERAPLSRHDGVVALCLVVGSLAAMWDAWADSFRIALTDEECGYVLLAPAVIAWLAWIRRRVLIDCPVRGAWAGIAAMAAGWSIYWYGYVSDPVLWRVGAVITAAGAASVAIGMAAMWRLGPAVAAAVFLVPVDPTGRYHIADPLQHATARATQELCDVLGIYVDRAGSTLSLNGVDVAVAEACNGMRMIITLALVCYVVAFTLPWRPWVRVLILAASPLFAIVSNVVRLVPTVWLFGHGTRKTAETFHEVSGWVMTVLAFALLLGFCLLLQSMTRGGAVVVADKPNPS
jgi:exosortase